MSDDERDSPGPENVEVNEEEEEQKVLGDAEEVLSEEEDAEDLMANIEKDYKEDDVLDRYEEENLDDNPYDEMSPEQRREAERLMRKRDRQRRGRRGRTPRAIAGVRSDSDDSDGPRRARRRIAEAAALGEADLELDADALGVDEPLPGTARQSLQSDAVMRQVKNKFFHFLTKFQERGVYVYVERIKTMCANNRESLEVDFRHLIHATGQENRHLYSDLGVWLLESPAEMLAIFDQAALAAVLRQFEHYKQIRSDIHVRVVNLTIMDKLREIRQVHLNTLVRTEGVVTRRTSVFPQLKQVSYQCPRCSQVLGPFYQNLRSELRSPSECPQCSHRGTFPIATDLTIYRNYQKLTLQESPGTVPPGRLPRTKEVILLHDLIDSARPGELIDLTGIYRNNFDSSLNHLHGFPVFATVIEANAIVKREDAFASFRLTEQDEREILRLAKDPHLEEKIIKSIAPSIFGHEDIKTGIALALFGSDEALHPNTHHRMRGDMNILILGDPGTAKSQFLKYIEKTAFRAVYTTGQGASAVGLTAAVRRDAVTKEWTLEGGALVLADKGVCLIDEFDKMNEKDRTSIHEAMEQQSISISKAGIVATLQARCSVIAAANPVRGRYDVGLSFAQNVDLTEPILSRFDILFVVRDEVDPDKDEELASFVVHSHMRSHKGARRPEEVNGSERNDEGPISQSLLRKYIMYAKQKHHPQMMHSHSDKLSQLYSELRKETGTGGMQIGVRHVEAMIRMSLAHARMHLRDYVNDDDVDSAIRIMLQSFIASQKHAVASSLQQKFRKYVTYKQDLNQYLYFTLEGLVKEQLAFSQARGRKSVEFVEIECEFFEAKVRGVGVHDLSSFYQSDYFKNHNFELVESQQKKRVIKKMLPVVSA